MPHSTTCYINTDIQQLSKKIGITIANNGFLCEYTVKYYLFVETIVLSSIFSLNCDIFYCSGFTDEIKVRKKQHLFNLGICCNLIYVSTVTFHQFNASLMNKSINIFKKN